MCVLARREAACGPLTRARSGSRALRQATRMPFHPTGKDAAEREAAAELAAVGVADGTHQPRTVATKMMISGGHPIDYVRPSVARAREGRGRAT